jgi:SAM-dependent methyltransferase
MAIRYKFIEDLLSLVSNPNDVVLDIGSGASVYKSSMNIGKYIGIDPYVFDDPNVVQASALDMPFEDDIFDFAFTVAALHLIGPNSFKEILRVLKPGGKFIIFDYNKTALRDLRAKTKIDHTIWSPHSLRIELNKAGFTKVKRLSHRPKIKSYYLQPISALKLKFGGSWVIFLCEKANS